MITDFTTLNDAMAATIKQHVEPVQTADAMSESIDDSMITPAVFIDLAEMDKGKKLSGGKLALDCTFIAYCVLSAKTERALLEVRNFAAAVAGVIEEHGRWGLADAVSRPTIVGLSPGVFERSGQGFECWTVEFTQTVHLGPAWRPDLTDPDHRDYVDGAWLAGCHPDNHYLGDVPK